MLRILLTIPLLALMGCATPYQRVSLGGGYDDTRLSADVFRVTFQGNGYTSRERIRDMLLLRSAELALAHGYPYFAPIDEEEYLHYGTVSSALVTAHPVKEKGFRFRGQTYSLSKQSESHLIACFKEPPPTLRYYEAKKVVRLVQQRYTMEKVGDASPAAITALDNAPE